MSAKSRDSGARFERKIAKELDALLGIKFKRQLVQYQDRGLSDLVSSDPEFPFSIECKRRTTGATCQSDWEAQAIKAALLEGNHPVVIYQFGVRPPLCRIWSDAYAESLGTDAVDGVKMDLSLEHFAHVCREIMAVRAMRKGASPQTVVSVEGI